jgi:hypothetical protein
VGNKQKHFQKVPNFQLFSCVSDLAAVIHGPILGRIKVNLFEARGVAGLKGCHDQYKGA